MWLILLVAIVVRVTLIAATPEYQPLNDPADYDRHARSIASGNGYPESILAPEGGPSAFRPPLYPAALAAVYLVSGDSWTAGRLLQAALGTLVVALIGMLAWCAWGRRVALTSMAVAAVAPPMLLPGVALLAEPLFLVLELGAVLAVLEHRRVAAGYRWAALAGLLAGLAVLTRTNGLVMLLPLALGVWVGRPRLTWRSIAAPLALVAASIVAIAPWTLRNAIALDSFVPVSTQAGFALAVTYNEAARTDPENPSLPHYRSEYSPLLERTELSEVELESELGARAREHMEDHPGYVLQTGLRNSVRTLHGDGFESARGTAAAVDIPRWLADAGVVGFYMLAALAIVGIFTPASRRLPPFVWAIPVLLVGSAVLITAKARYRAVADPFLVLLAGVALAAAWERLSRARGKRGYPEPP